MQLVKEDALLRLLFWGSFGFVMLAFVSVFYSVAPWRTFKHVVEEVFLNFLVFWGVFLWSKFFAFQRLSFLLKTILLSFLFIVLLYFLLAFWWFKFGPIFCKDYAPHQYELLPLLFGLGDWQGFLLNRQNLSSYFLFPASMSWSYFLLAKNKKSRFWAVCFFVIFCLMLFLTSKRSALLGMFLAGSLAVFLSRRIRWLFVFCLFFVVGLFVVFKTPLKRFFVREKISVLLTSDRTQWKNAGSIPIRYYGLPFYLERIKDSPFKGVGFGIFNIKANPETKEIVKKSHLAHAHNVWINIALFLGVPGLIFFLLFLLGQIVFSFKMFLRSDSFFVQWLALGFIVYFFAFWVRYQFDDTFRHVVAAFYYLNSGLVLGSLQSNE